MIYDLPNREAPQVFIETVLFSIFRNPFYLLTSFTAGLRGCFYFEGKNACQVGKSFGAVKNLISRHLVQNFIMLQD